jgi:hypothetical protein
MDKKIRNAQWMSRDEKIGCQDDKISVKEKKQGKISYGRRISVG